MVLYGISPTDIDNRLRDSLWPDQVPKIKAALFKENVGKASYREKLFLVNVLEYFHRYAYENFKDINENEKKAIYGGLISEFLRGAHIVFDDNTPLLYGNWSNKELSRLDNSNGRMINTLVRRKSSHQSEDLQFAIRSSCIKEALFGTRNDETGAKHTWVQLESHPMEFKNLLNLFNHLLAFLIHKITNKNIGQFGNSIYTEKSPLNLRDTVKLKNSLLAEYLPSESNLKSNIQKL